VQNRFAYLSEIEAIRSHLPEEGIGLEIGVGSGLFAQPLKIDYGVEPSQKMIAKANRRGVKVVKGVAEELPFKNNSCDYALMVTTICFLVDIIKSFEEARLVIKSKGKFIIGFIDKNNPIGKIYQKYKHQNVFYNLAEFYSIAEVTDYMKRANFINFQYTQTIFHIFDKITKVENVKQGIGQGSFVVISGIKK